MADRSYSIEDLDHAARRALRAIEIGGEAETAYEEYVGHVADRLDDPAQDRNDVVRDLVRELHGLTAGPRTPTERALVHSCDPRSATLEPEYYADIDRERYEPLKPLHWLWMQFDRSRVGRNLHLGVLFRRMLAARLFKRCGRNVKIFHDVEFTYGYNLEVGDDVVIHRGVLLDDRGGIVLGNHVSISDFANVYSHSHSPTDIGDVTRTPTRIGDGVRITYHATVLAGADMGADSMVGAHGLLLKPLAPHHIAGGVPAKFIRSKPREGRSV